MRLIDADELIGVFRMLALMRSGQYRESYTNADGNRAMEIACAEYIISQQKTIDAEPVKHARWIERRTNNGNVHYTCSCCVKEVSYPYAKKRWKYCIECGAKMDLKEGDKQ
mgnify:CR=1